MSYINEAQGGSSGGGGITSAVTSVGIQGDSSVSGIIAFTGTGSGNPNTSTGTFIVSFSTQSTGNFLGAPTATSGFPTYRSIFGADLPLTSAAAGTYASPTITIDGTGRITSALTGSGGGGGTVSGTTGYHGKFVSTSVIGNANWSEDSGGALLYNAFGSNKGSISAPVINFNPNNGSNETGFFTDVNAFLQLTVNETLAGGWTSNKFFPPGALAATGNTTSGYLSSGTALNVYGGSAGFGFYDRSTTNIVRYQTTAVGGSNALSFQNCELALTYTASSATSYTSPMSDTVINMTNVAARTVSLADENTGSVGTGIIRIIFDGAATAGGANIVISPATGKKMNGVTNGTLTINVNSGMAILVAVGSDWIGHAF